MKRLFLKIAGPRFNRLFWGAGLLVLCFSLYHVVGTAVYVKEAIVVPGVVVDVRQKPFDSTSDALLGGNWAMAGDVSYQPHVRFSLPNGLVINRLMTDAGNHDYTIGQAIEVITMPQDPSTARIHQWNFLWGGSVFTAIIGACLLISGLLLRIGTIQAPVKKAKQSPAKSQSTKRSNKKGQSPKRQRSPRKKSTSTKSKS